MQIRLFASLAGGLLGVATAYTIHSRFGVDATIALIGCSAIGLSIGYVVSMVIDVFTASRAE